MAWLPTDIDADDDFDTVEDSVGVVGTPEDDEQVEGWLRQASIADPDGLSALSAFARRMRQFPRLDNAGQVRLVAVFQEGRRSAELLSRQDVKGSKVSGLQQKVREGDNALEHLSGSLFRLELLIARELSNKRYGAQKTNDVLPDLIAEANVALMEAALRFDVRSGGNFSSYAARAMRDRVRGVIAKDSPAKTASSWTRLRRIAIARIPEMREELGRKPTIDEIRADLLVTCLNWAQGKLTPEQLLLPPEEQYEWKMKRLRKQGMLAALEQLADVLKSGQTMTSLETPLGDEGGDTIGSVMPDETSSNEMFDAVELGDLRRRLGEALKHLTDREKDVLLHRFGFVDGTQWTYPKIAEVFKVSPERIRQIEREALMKLQMQAGGAGLIGFLS